MRIILRIASMLCKYRIRVILAYCCLFTAAGLALFIPRLTGQAIDLAIGLGQPGTLTLVALSIVAASFFRGIFGYGHTYLARSLSQRVAYDLRNKIYDHLQQLSYAFHDRSRTGQLMSRATVDVEGVRAFVGFALFRGVYFLALLLAITCLLLITNWKLALLCLSILPFISFRTVKISSRLRGLWTQIHHSIGVLGNIVQENLVGTRVVRAFCRQDFESEKFRSRAQILYRQELEASRQVALNSPLLSLALILAMAVILWYGGRQVIAAELTPGELAQFILYLFMLRTPIRMIGWLVMLYSRAVSCGERIFTILDEVSPVREKPGAIDMAAAEGLIRFDGVSFSYSTSSPALHNITFEARPGQTIALVGATGSGKSTIANLIPRFYDATAGSISIDNTDVKDITLSSLRHLIGIVHQDTFLFSGTIRENISYGKTDATTEEITATARAAQLHDFIATLPQGYDTWIGERGVTLSGGQKQRLAIARTLLLNPSIIIMDDSTSSVDTETEYHIQQAMTKLLSGRTAFIIAQRLWSVQMADIILVLRDGEIIERGTHHELMARSSFYRELYSTQLQPGEAVEKTEPGLAATTAGDSDPPEATDNKKPNNHYRHHQPSPTTLDRSDDTTFGKVYDSRVVSRLLSYIAPYKLQVLMATGATLVYTFTTVAVPYLIGVAINESIATGDLLRLDMIILLFLGNGLLNWLAHYTQLIMEAKAGKQALFDLRCRLFNHLQRLPLPFFDRNATGRIMSRLQNDVQHIGDFLSSSALTAAAELLSLAGIVIALTIMNLELALITFTIIPFLFLFLVFWRRHVRSYYLQIRAAIAAVNGMLQETISGVRVIQSLSRERVNSRRFEKLNRAHFAANVGAARISATMAPVVELLMAGATASVLVFGGAKTLAGGLQAGVLVAFAIYIQRFFDPIRTLTMEYAELQQAMASGVRIFELLDVKAEAAETDRPQKLSRIQGEIRFENVSFGYNPEQEVLHNINLVIHPGEKVALVGPTGAGKSTLVSLLTRFYRVSQGHISIDGYDLNCVEPASFLQQVSVVLQEPFLFSATIRDNIRYGCLTASNEEIVAAAEAVGADGFIRHLAKGYLTELEERGQNLSMGQRQLISFARALVGSPRIILLDEATASIDSYTETLIQKAMGHLLLGRTALIIAHRLSTVRNADRIIVLDKGKIVEEGRHEELINRGGLYARLYRMSYNSVSAPH